ncbi:MAG TPA: DUF6600 domain-containing protein [Puia sp.]|nr:DUF6600 domain-containing protein [Puia sp.]
MSKTIFITLLGISIFTGIIPSITQTARAQASVSFQVFYDQLGPYGSWVDYPSYGYVWMPAGREGFRPYGTRGHWIYTEDGWTWVSDYSWGWATFHYGNWFYDDSYGWMWAPGYEWAPAWVTWGEYGGNYCWAPIGPHVNIGVSFATYRPAYNYWNFCPRDRITNVNPSRYYVNNIHNRAVINNITVINNVRTVGGGEAYHRGPAPASVERFTHTAIHPVAIRASSRPGAASVQNGQLAIYRPTVRNYNAGIRPSAVRDLHALRPLNNAHPAVQPAGHTAQPAGHADRPVHNDQPAGHTVQPNAHSSLPPHADRPAALHPSNAHDNRSTIPGTRPAAHTDPSASRPSGTPSPRAAMPPHQQHHPAETGPVQPHPANPQPHQPSHELQPGHVRQQPNNPVPQHTSPRPMPHPAQPRAQPQPHTANPMPHQQPVRQVPMPMNRPAAQPHPGGPPPGAQPPHEHHR